MQGSCFCCFLTKGSAIRVAIEKFYITFLYRGLIYWCTRTCNTQRFIHTIERCFRNRRHILHVFFKYKTNQSISFSHHIRSNQTTKIKPSLLQNISLFRRCPLNDSIHVDVGPKTISLMPPNCSRHDPESNQQLSSEAFFFNNNATHLFGPPSPMLPLK